MITFKQTETNIQIYFLNELIINHSCENPAFYLGSGTPSIESYRGNYKIEDYIEKRIPLHQFSLVNNTLTFYHNNLTLTLTFEVVEGRLVCRLDSNQFSNRFWMRLVATPDEKIYGGGEQASYFNLRNRNFPLWTSEPGVGRDKNSLTTFYADLKDKAGGDYYTTCYPEPTYVSTRKYWLHVDSFAYGDFNFKNRDFHELMFWEVPKQFIISFKSTYLEIIKDLTDYTKRPPKLPDYLLDGMILGVQGGTEQIVEYLEKALDHDVKVSGVWFQDWAGINRTTFGKRLYWNWVLNETLYPNIKETIAHYEKKNISFLTYICPFLLVNESLYNEAGSQNFLVLNKDGAFYKEDFGEFLCGIVDLTNPDAFNWYKNIIKKNIIDLGIKGWMADFGEYLPVDCYLHNGVDAKIVHNQWPILWAKCNYEAVLESGKLGEVFYFMRAGAHGSQHYSTSMWAGDQSVNWELHDGIASTIPMALSVGMIGNPFTHSDIGGYTSLHGNIRTQELFERWLEMNVFTSFMRTHEGNRPTQNFQFYNSESTLKLMSRMTKIRVDLKPYIKHLIDEAITYGYPLQRALFLHYEDELITYDLQYQYLFGKDILVKPVIEPNQLTTSVYLPKDEWIHMWTGTAYQGGTEVVVDCPIGCPPVFYRKNASFSKLFHEITLKYQ